MSLDRKYLIIGGTALVLVIGHDNCLQNATTTKYFSGFDWR